MQGGEQICIHHGGGEFYVTVPFGVPPGQVFHTNLPAASDADAIPSAASSDAPAWPASPASPSLVAIPAEAAVSTLPLGIIATANESRPPPSLPPSPPDASDTFRIRPTLEQGGAAAAVAAATAAATAAAAAAEAEAELEHGLGGRRGGGASPAGSAGAAARGFGGWWEA